MSPLPSTGRNRCALPHSAHRPFATIQPYAECGPIFLHADSCTRYVEGATLPPMLGSPQYIISGYSSDERIIYSTGTIVPTTQIAHYAANSHTRRGCLPPYTVGIQQLLSMSD
ncbi:MAG: DUF1203 domain-containing protein [Caldilineaceae bacterium]